MMHVLNRILATVLALALLLGGLLTVVEIALAALDQPAWLVPYPRWSGWLGSHGFDSGIVRAVLIGVAVVGLLLLIAALRPGRPHAVSIPSAGPGIRVLASRRGVERTLTAAARRPDGVSGAKVRAGRRRVKVVARTELRDPGDLASRVGGAVDERLSELGLAGRLRPRVSVSRRGA